MAETIRVGKHGTVAIPAHLRQRLGLEEGSLVLLEEAPDGLKLRPAEAIPVEIYTPERKAAFLLENAVDAADYERALQEVRKMGLDPASIPHHRP